VARLELACNSYLKTIRMLASRTIRHNEGNEPEVIFAVTEPRLNFSNPPMIVTGTGDISEEFCVTVVPEVPFTKIVQVAVLGSDSGHSSLWEK
jgi:hypothetical protein